MWLVVQAKDVSAIMLSHTRTACNKPVIIIKNYYVNSNNTLLPLLACSNYYIIIASRKLVLLSPHDIVVKESLQLLLYTHINTINKLLAIEFQLIDIITVLISLYSFFPCDNIFFCLSSCTEFHTSNYLLFCVTWRHLQ